MAAIIMLAFLYARLVPFRDCEIAIASSVATALDKLPPTSAGAPRCSTTKKRRRLFNSRGLIQGLPRRAAELDRARATRCPRKCLLIDVVRRRRAPLTGRFLRRREPSSKPSYFIGAWHPAEDV